MSATVLAHDTAGLVNTSPDAYLGNPMYEVAGVHAPALVAVALLGLATWWMGRRHDRDRSTPRAYQAFHALPQVDRWIASLVGASGLAHLALVPTHLDLPTYAVLFAVAGVVQVWLVRGRLAGTAWSHWLRPILFGSLLGYAISGMSGEAPDQVGMLVKLAELTALALATAPAPHRLLQVRATAGYLAVSTLVVVGSWAGAMQAGEGGHHLGQTPPPGVLIPPGEDRPATATEQAATDALYAAIRDSIAPYADPTVAVDAGYAADDIVGQDFHADNEELKDDGRILDPAAPETLVYGVGSSGEPVLLGAMFQMDHSGQRGPAPGGPLTVWHAHDHICMAPVPPFLAGIAGPYGACPLGSLTLPITNEMFHVWTIEGAPDPFGDLDEEWLEAELARR